MAQDVTPPSVSIDQAASQSDPTASSPILFTVVFSEPVSDFVTGDVTVGGSALPTTALVSGSGTTYTVSVSGMSATGFVTASIAPGRAHDAANNPNTASSSLDNTVQYTPLAPAVTISLAPGTGEPSGPNRSGAFRIAFSAVIDPASFSTADLSLASSTASGALKGGLVPEVAGLTYILPVSAGGDGTIVLTMAVGGACAAGHFVGGTCDAGFGSLPATNTDNQLLWDQTRPGVSLNQAVGQADPTTVSPIAFTLTFSEPVTGLTASDLTLSGTAHPATVAISGVGPAYTLTVSGMSSSGTVSVAMNSAVVVDTALNSNTASTSVDNTVQFVLDTTPPSVTINQAAGQVDPTSNSPIVFAVQFSEAVADFVTGDVTVGGSALPTSAVVSGSGTTYTVAVSGMSAPGSVIATIAAGRAHDAAGNSSLASTSVDNTVTFTAPTTVQPATGLRVSAMSANAVTFRWTPPVLGPAPKGYLLEGGATPGSTAAAIPLTAAPLSTLTVPSGTYYVRLRSLGIGGPSGASNEIQIFVNTPTAPSPPDRLLAAVNGSSLELSWRQTFLGSAPTALALDVTGTVAATLPLPVADSLVFPSVPPGTYTLALRSLNGAVSSAPSSSVTITVPAACPGPPAVPLDVVAVVQAGVVTLAWEPPSSGPAATSYVLSVGGAYVGTFGLGAARTFSSPAPPGAYQLRVAAVNACGAGPFSASQTVVVP
jgi:hypothetical protein